LILQGIVGKVKEVEMTDQVKAKIILKELDKKINVNWNLKRYYRDAICSGLQKIAEVEAKGENQC